MIASGSVIFLRLVGESENELIAIVGRSRCFARVAQRSLLLFEFHRISDTLFADGRDRCDSLAIKYP